MSRSLGFVRRFHVTMRKKEDVYHSLQKKVEDVNEILLGEKVYVQEESKKMFVQMLPLIENLIKINNELSHYEDPSDTASLRDKTGLISMRINFAQCGERINNIYVEMLSFISNEQFFLVKRLHPIVVQIIGDEKFQENWNVQLKKYENFLKVLEVSVDKGYLLLEELEKEGFLDYLKAPSEKKLFQIRSQVAEGYVNCLASKNYGETRYLVNASRGREYIESNEAVMLMQIVEGAIGNNADMIHEICKTDLFKRFFMEESQIAFFRVLVREMDPTNPKYLIEDIEIKFHRIYNFEVAGVIRRKIIKKAELLGKISDSTKEPFGKVIENIKVIFPHASNYSDLSSQIEAQIKIVDTNLNFASIGIQIAEKGAKLTISDIENSGIPFSIVDIAMVNVRRSDPRKSRSDPRKSGFVLRENVSAESVVESLITRIVGSISSVERRLREINESIGRRGSTNYTRRATDRVTGQQVSDVAQFLNNYIELIRKREYSNAQTETARVEKLKIITTDQGSLLFKVANQFGLGNLDFVEAQLNEKEVQPNIGSCFVPYPLFIQDLGIILQGLKGIKNIRAQRAGSNGAQEVRRTVLEEINRYFETGIRENLEVNLGKFPDYKFRVLRASMENASIVNETIEPIFKEVSEHYIASDARKEAGDDGRPPKKAAPYLLITNELNGAYVIPAATRITSGYFDDFALHHVYNVGHYYSGFSYSLRIETLSKAYPSTGNTWRLGVEGSNGRGTMKLFNATPETTIEASMGVAMESGLNPVARAIYNQLEKINNRQETKYNLRKFSVIVELLNSKTKNWSEEDIKTILAYSREVKARMLYQDPEIEDEWMAIILTLDDKIGFMVPNVWKDLKEYHIIGQVPIFTNNLGEGWYKEKKGMVKYARAFNKGTGTKPSWRVIRQGEIAQAA